MTCRPPFWIFFFLLGIGPGSVLQRLDGTENDDGTPTVTSVSEVRALPNTAFNVAHPLAFTGIVTLMDPKQNLLVLQDATGAIALHPDPPQAAVHPGQRVLLQAANCSPFLVNCPDYPYHPVSHDLRTAFEAPDNEGEFFVNRMRGWLCPPVSGQYTFWISSDDSSDLWLSSSASPVDAHRIAFVPAGAWTERHEWTRFPSQRSESRLLRAGECYYIEAFQEQQLEQSHLAVAWEGPGIEQTIIDGKFLVACDNPGEPSPLAPAPHAAQGILREHWTNYSVGSVAPFVGGRTPEGGLTIHGVRVSVLEDGVWPKPLPVDLSQPLPAEDAYRWMEGSGEVTFLASDGTSATLEIVSGQTRLSVHVAQWHGEAPAAHPHLYAKFRGVCIGSRQTRTVVVPNLIWTPTEKEISFSDKPEVPPPVASAMPPVSSANDPASKGYYFTDGVVTFNDVVLNKNLLFVQDAAAGILVSQGERRLNPDLQIGQYVQFGGSLLSSEFARVIRLVNLNVLGWKNLPVPAAMPTNIPEANYRDGEWTEAEGVVHAVNADNRLTLMRGHVPFAAWIGRTDRGELDTLVNSTLRVRGVMSLTTFEVPTLLVPSREYSEVSEPAPPAPTRPTLVAHLRDTVPRSGLAHLVKLAGVVTYTGDRYFYLQDESGATRVQTEREPALKIGQAIEVMGFPYVEGERIRLGDALWKPLDGIRPIAAAALNLQNLDFQRNGMVVALEARLLAEKARGTDNTLELQIGAHVFEAVLTAPKEKVPPIPIGSLLRVTGVCVLETPLSAGSEGANDGLAVALTRVLLRSARDVAILQGPPWWTWKRVSLLIGILLAVLTGTLLRSRSQNRRFARQQAVRLQYAREMLENQESERRRIAASLHDSLGQDLLVIRSQAGLALQAGADGAGLRQRLETISETTLQALNQVREITHNLRPYQLDRLGLTQAIRALTRKVSETCPIVFASHVDDIDDIFDNEFDIHLYRIVQEGINNIVKHSEATEATVVIKLAADRLAVSIRDNGRGFLLANHPPGAGFGLGSIQERAKIMGGTFKIDSSSGAGVNLQIEIPCPERRNEFVQQARR